MSRSQQTQKFYEWKWELIAEMRSFGFSQKAIDSTFINIEHWVSFWEEGMQPREALEEDLSSGM